MKLEFKEFLKKANVSQNSIKENILSFGWYLHHTGVKTFTSPDIRALFGAAHLPCPDVSTYLKRMTSDRPQMIMSEGKKYKLTMMALDRFNRNPYSSATEHEKSPLLERMKEKIQSNQERNFFEEAIRCYNSNCYRATIVMVWNLCISHLINWILSDSSRVVEFNNSLLRRFPNKKVVISNRNSFDELKESELIEIAVGSQLISKSQGEILKAKLGRRNSAAHPSDLVFTKSQADDVITDLVINIIEKIT